MVEELLGVTLKEAASFAAGVVAIFSIFIEITPVKWNPVS